VRMVANMTGDSGQFPLCTIAAGAHIPGAIIGEGARLATSIHQRGHRLNHWTVDRAYPSGLPYEFHIAWDSPRTWRHRLGGNGDGYATEV
jgi:hypothetical protein